MLSLDINKASVCACVCAIVMLMCAIVMLMVVIICGSLAAPVHGPVGRPCYDDDNSNLL